jgi:hypothetical protein
MDVDVFVRDDSPYWFAVLCVDGKRKKESLRLPHKGPGAVKRSAALKAAEDRQQAYDQGTFARTLREVLDHVYRLARSPAQT